MKICIIACYTPIQYQYSIVDMKEIEKLVEKTIFFPDRISLVEQVLEDLARIGILVDFSYLCDLQDELRSLLLVADVAVSEAVYGRVSREGWFGGYRIRGPGKGGLCSVGYDSHVGDLPRFNSWLQLSSGEIFMVGRVIRSLHFGISLDGFRPSREIRYQSGDLLLDVQWMGK